MSHPYYPVLTLSSIPSTFPWTYLLFHSNQGTRNEVIDVREDLGKVLTRLHPKERGWYDDIYWYLRILSTKQLEMQHDTNMKHGDLKWFSSYTGGKILKHWQFNFAWFNQIQGLTMLDLSQNGLVAQPKREMDDERVMLVLAKIPRHGFGDYLVTIWLVVDLPLWKKIVSWDDEIPNIWKNQPTNKLWYGYMVYFAGLNADARYEVLHAMLE